MRDISARELKGHNILAVERFQDETRWMVEFAVRKPRTPYQNMILFHRRFFPLLQRRPMNELKAIANALKTTKELMLKVNSLRERAGLSAIE